MMKKGLKYSYTESKISVVKTTACSKEKPPGGGNHPQCGMCGRELTLARTSLFAILGRTWGVVATPRAVSFLMVIVLRNKDHRIVWDVPSTMVCDLTSGQGLAFQVR